MIGATSVVSKGIVSDVVILLVTHPETDAIGLRWPRSEAGLCVANTAITQRGETGREELRQQGKPSGPGSPSSSARPAARVRMAGEGPGRRWLA
jgi:hypothetical protein